MSFSSNITPPVIMIMSKVLMLSVIYLYPLISSLVLDTDDSELLKVCGYDIPHKVTSSGNKMTVHFKTDSSAVRKGFRATWRKVATSGANSQGIK